MNENYTNMFKEYPDILTVKDIIAVDILNFATWGNCEVGNV